MFWRLVLAAFLVDFSLSFGDFYHGEFHADGCCGGGSCTTKCRDGLSGRAVVPGQPPRFVYRADFREPVNDVFKNGFKCLGKNDNLVEHTSGVSTHYGVKKNSLFVSTSSEEAKAVEWARNIITSAKNPRNQKAQKYRNNNAIYVYKIRADWNYFNMKESLLAGYRATNNEEFREQAEGVAEVYREYEACGGVKPDEVMSSTKYNWGRLNNPDPEEMNGRYVDKDTQASSNVYV